MAKGLTKKQRVFVNEYADTGNGVKAALKAYDTDDYATAGVMAVENLEKPKIIEALAKRGISLEDADAVVGHLLVNAEREETQLNAADKIYKRLGGYAAEKHINVNIKAEPNERIKKLAERLNAN